MSDYSNEGKPLTVESLKDAIAELEKLPQPVLIHPTHIAIPGHVMTVFRRNKKLNARKNKRRRWRDAHLGTVTRWP